MTESNGLQNYSLGLYLLISHTYLEDPGPAPRRSDERMASVHILARPGSAQSNVVNAAAAGGAEEVVCSSMSTHTCGGGMNVEEGNREMRSQNHCYLKKL